MPQPAYLSGAIRAGDCVANGWNLVLQNFGLLIGTSFLAILLIACIPCVNFLLMGPVLGGIYFLMLKAMRNEPVNFGMLFKGFERFLPLMFIGLVLSVPDIGFQTVQFVVDINDLIKGGGIPIDRNFFQQAPPAQDQTFFLLLFAAIALAFAIFGFVWKTLLFFAVPLAVEYGIGPIEAFKLSVSAALSNIGGLIVLTILEIVIALFGIFAFCIGIFVAIPVIWAANAFAYRQVFPYRGELNV